MHRPTLPIVMIACAFSVFNVNKLDAKECDCKQHSAGASGNGSCSLTETSSRCSISYTTAFLFPYGITLAQIPQEHEDLLRSLENDFDLEEMQRFENNDVFIFLDRVSFPELQIRFQNDAKLARDVILQAFLANFDDYPGSDVFEQTFGLDRETGIDQNIIDDFIEDGCLEIEGPDIRFLLIHSDSSFDGDCNTPDPDLQ